MELINLRYNTAPNHTDGLFYINDKFRVYTLEDGHRETKVHGETRIPDGRYKVEFREVGNFHRRYGRRYKDWHKGMLWVKEVPNFKYILIHVGNYAKDTAGCLLVGNEPERNKDFISDSRTAYEAIYPEIRDALIAGEEVWITYKTIA